MPGLRNVGKNQAKRTRSRDRERRGQARAVAPAWGRDTGGKGRACYLVPDRCPGSAAAVTSLFHPRGAGPGRGCSPPTLWASVQRFPPLTKPPSGFAFSTHCNCFICTRFISSAGQRTDVSVTTIQYMRVCWEPRLAASSWGRASGPQAAPLDTAIKGQGCAIAPRPGTRLNAGLGRSSPSHTSPIIDKYSHA